MRRFAQLIDEWSEAAGAEAYFSASRVQDRLFDLYGAVPPGPAKQLVETWLTLTVSRDLFSGAEIVELVDELRLFVEPPVPTA